MKVFQLKITIKESKPPIWRRILIHPDTLLVDVHRILQSTMGWTNSHLHLFSDGMFSYAPKEFEVEDTKNSRTVKLSRLINREEDRMTYEYDFGDGWEHVIILEKIIEVDEKEHIPRCIGGKRHCPPEDVGGVWGYEDFLKTLSNPKDPDYEDMMLWSGGEFDPDFFDPDEINELLKMKDFGCIWIE